MQPVTLAPSLHRQQAANHAAGAGHSVAVQTRARHSQGTGTETTPSHCAPKVYFPPRPLAPTLCLTLHRGTWPHTHKHAHIHAHAFNDMCARTNTRVRACVLKARPACEPGPSATQRDAHGTWLARAQHAPAAGSSGTSPWPLRGTPACAGPLCSRDPLPGSLPAACPPAAGWVWCQAGVGLVAGRCGFGGR